jgi:putative FmdB family regulatory protein
MPLYEYECDVCGHRFEVIQKLSDEPVAACPVCSGAVHKLQSAPAFQFKGSGWYVTDYARKDKGPTPSADAGAKPSEGSETSDKSTDATKSTSTESASSTPAAGSPAKSE